MTPATPSSELFRLQGQLIEMLAERDELHVDLELITRTGSADAETMAATKRQEIAALESGIGSFLLERIRSVDDIRNPLLAMQAAQKVCEAEAQRATNQALVWKRQIDTVLDLVKVCMKHLDELGTWKPKESRKLQSALGSIMLVANGGKAPVEITDETLVPDEFKNITVKLNYGFALKLMVSLAMEDWKDEEEFETLRRAVDTGRIEPNKSAIEAELNKTCEECEGAGEKCCNPDEHTRPTDCTERCHTCRYCGGTGKRGVPGARLADRGEHVRVSGLTK